MRILHTSDWHVGKVLKGRDRYDEHEAVLSRIVQIAGEQQADLVLVAGDLFESSAPSAESQGLVMRTLLALREDGRDVVVIAGNHDNQALLDKVYRPALSQLGLHVLGLPRRPDSGGMLTLRTRSGETAKVAALPFVSKRYAVGAAEIVFGELAEHALDYSRRVGEMVRLLTEGFTGDSLNIVMAHATLLDAQSGGGERAAQTVLDYALPARLFPPTAHYVALGHLHRHQEVDGPCPIYYSGSPLAVDFGEEQNEPVVLSVTAQLGARADAKPIPVTGGRRLRTLRGTLGQVIAEGEQIPEDYLRVVLAEPSRAGLGDLVREKLPNALEVRLDDAYQAHRGDGEEAGALAPQAGRSPLELFGDYLARENIEDPRLTAMFADLLDEVTGAA